MADEHDSMTDAQILADADVIKADPARYSEAQKAAGQLAKEAAIRAKSYDAISSHPYPTMRPGHPLSQKE